MLWAPLFSLKVVHRKTDLIEQQQTEMGNNKATADKITVRGLNTSALFWQHMQETCHRTVFYPGPNHKDGTQCRTAEEMDEAILATRNFWFHTAVCWDEQWRTVLDEYVSS